MQPVFIIGIISVLSVLDYYFFVINSTHFTEKFQCGGHIHSNNPMASLHDSLPMLFVVLSLFLLILNASGIVILVLGITVGLI